MQRSCAVVGTAAVAVAKVAAAIRAVRVFVIGVSLSVGPRKRRELGQPRFVLQSQSLKELSYQISPPSHAFDAVARGVIDSMPGVFGTTRRAGCVFAISRLCAGNPASPQSVPASVLLNFFMPAPDSR
jgi:hypothetical protein